MADQSKQKLWVGLAAAGVLIGAALLFHWATTDDDENEDGSASAASP